MPLLKRPATQSARGGKSQAATTTRSQTSTKFQCQSVEGALFDGVFEANGGEREAGGAAKSKGKRQRAKG